MIKLIRNGYLLGELGVFNLPDIVQREEGDTKWKVHSTVKSFWEFRDIDHGGTYYAMKEAVKFAVTYGSLPYKQTTECIELSCKCRLTETGVLGVYLFRGLEEAYWVIYDGNLIKVPLEKGKGFIKATRILEGLRNSKIEELLESFDEGKLCSLEN